MKDKLKENCMVLISNGMYLQYIGEVDVRANDKHLFKTLYSPFASSKWFERSSEELEQMQISFIVYP